MNEMDLVRRINADVEPADPQRLARARERLMAVIAEEQAKPVEARRRHRRLRVASWSTVGVAAAAAAVVVLVGTSPTPTAPTPTPVNAAFVLNEAADHAIHQKDEPIHPGQYRYVSERISAVGMGFNGPITQFAWREHDVTTTWVPYDQTRTWVQDMSQDGPFEILVDNGATEQDKQEMRSHYPHGRSTARCGDFAHIRAGKCTGMFDDKQLTSAMLATLPRDPHKLLQRMGGDLFRALQMSNMWLRSGLVPGDLRAAMYRALALVPGIEITDRFANLDGRTGVAFGGHTSGYREDIIIDPATGQYIGERAVDDGTLGMPAGTVHDSSSVVTGVVDAVGQKPQH